MTKDEAFQMLNERVSSATAIEILEVIDSDEVEIFGVEGFLLKSSGECESKLDLMFDLSSVQNLSRRERASFVRQFIAGRMGDNIFFEVYGE